MGGYSLVLICLECAIQAPDGTSQGSLMTAVSRSRAGPPGLIYQCRRCKRRLELAYVDERLAKTVTVEKQKSAQKRTPYRR